MHKINNVFKMFDWKHHDYPQFNEQRQVGLIAQEVEKVLPEVIIGKKITGKGKLGGGLSVCYDKIVALLIEGINEQQDQIKKMEEKIDEISARSYDMIMIRKDVSDLKQMLNKNLSFSKTYEKGNPSGGPGRFNCKKDPNELSLV